MSLFDQINDAIKQAMLAKEKVALQALRGVKKEFLEAKTAKDSGGELTDDMAIKIMQKMVKQRKDAAEIYQQQNRPELAADEVAEIAVIEQFLPAQMSDAELEVAIRAIVGQVGASSPQDMGKVMGVATKQLAGKAEGRLISGKVKEVLNSL